MWTALVYITVPQCTIQNVPECLWMFMNAWRSMSLHAGPSASIQVHELACSYISLHAVPWAYMKFHELTYIKFHELACSSMSLYAVPFFVGAALKNFAVLVIKPLTVRLRSHNSFYFIITFYLLSSPSPKSHSNCLYRHCTGLGYNKEYS